MGLAIFACRCQDAGTAKPNLNVWAVNCKVFYTCLWDGGGTMCGRWTQGTRIQEQAGIGTGIPDIRRGTSAGIFKQSVEARNRVGIGLSYRPSRVRIFKLLRSPRIDAKEPIPPGCVAWAGIFKPLWGPGIDAQASIPPTYVAWRAGTITLFLLGALHP